MGRTGVFLGVDLSSHNLAVRGKTRVIIGRSKGGSLTFEEICSPKTDRELIEIFAESRFELCGIDSPLSLPPCSICRIWDCLNCPYRKLAVEGLDFREEVLYHYRIADLVFRKLGWPVKPKPALSNGGPVDITPLTLRWQKIARELFQLGRLFLLGRICEVYSRGIAALFSLSLFEQNLKLNSDLMREQFWSVLMKRYPVKIPDTIFSELIADRDSFDAALACLGSWFASRGEVNTPEDLAEQLPLSDEFKDLARELLYKSPLAVYPRLN